MTTDHSQYLTTQELAAELTKAGFKVKASSLAVYACNGDGPAFRKFGRTRVYTLADGLAWAQSRLSRRVGSTAELSQTAAAHAPASPSTSPN